MLNADVNGFFLSLTSRAQWIRSTVQTRMLCFWSSLMCLYRLTISLLAACCVAHVAWAIGNQFCSVHYDPFGSAGASALARPPATAAQLYATFIASCNSVLASLPSSTILHDAHQCILLAPAEGCQTALEVVLFSAGSTRPNISIAYSDV